MVGDAGDAQRGGQVGLAGAGAADKTTLCASSVKPVVASAVTCLHQGGLEVEAGQITMDRELAACNWWRIERMARSVCSA